MTEDDDITLLLIRAGANLSARDKSGNTAWDLASSASKRAIINRYFR
jgi:ankyrin repeat protein